MGDPWEIIPQVGVGPLRFGMTRQQVRSAIAAPAEEFRRTPGANVADKFRSIMAVAYYSADDALEAIEFSDLQQVVVKKMNLTTTPTERLLHEVLLVDPDAEIGPKSSGFISRILGAGIWTEGDRSKPPQSVIVFAPGYYD